MSFNYNVRQVRGVTVVELSGRMTLSDGDMQLHGLVRDLLKQGQKNILLNLRDVTYLDSSGVGELFGCFTTVRGQGGSLKISNPNERVQNLLHLTKLNTVIELLENESAAVQSFSNAGAA
jgi:anti-sigma B factor antagonist